MLPFGVALILAVVITPVFRQLALRLGFLAHPVDRSVHSAPVPYLGGAALYVAFALTYAILGITDPLLPGILVAGGFIVLLGLVDDLNRLPAAVKLAGQIVCALILLSYGVEIERVTNPMGGFIYFGMWSGPVTVLWVVAFTNAINFIDGLDGLAAGVAGIAAITLATVAVQTGQPAVALYLTGALAGVSFGFLPFNFHPAKIFMGDAGSMFLGFVLAAVSIAGTLKSTAAIALGIPVLAVGLPVMDTAFAIVRRWRNGQALYEPDRGHLHHRLLQMGMTQREAVMLMYCISGWMGISALALTHLRPAPGLGVMAFAFVSLYFGAKKFGIMDLERREYFR